MADLDPGALYTETDAAVLAAIFPFDVPGQPAGSLFLGQGVASLPRGVQPTGRRGREEELLQTAAIFETGTPRHPRVHA